MRRLPLIVVAAVIAGVVAAAPAQGQDDPATCLSLVDFSLPAATIVGTPGNDTLRGTDGPDVIVGLGGRTQVASSSQGGRYFPHADATPETQPMVGQPDLSDSDD